MATVAGSQVLIAATGPLRWTFPGSTVYTPAVVLGDGTALFTGIGHPASTAVMNASLSVRGGTALAIPAPRAALWTIRPAQCRSSRRPSAARNTGPQVRSPMGRPIARAGRGASGTVTTLPPLRMMVSGRWPRFRPKVPDIGASSLGDPQPVQREQGHRGMLGGMSRYSSLVTR